VRFADRDHDEGLAAPFMYTQRPWCRPATRASQAGPCGTISRYSPDMEDPRDSSSPADFKTSISTCVDTVPARDTLEVSADVICRRNYLVPGRWDATVDLPAGCRRRVRPGAESAVKGDTEAPPESCAVRSHRVPILRAGNERRFRYARPERGRRRRQAKKEPMKIHRALGSVLRPLRADT